MLGTAGFGAGYHFSLIGLNVEREYRGRVFAIGYALGSLGTYFLTLIPESYFSEIKSLFIYIPCIILNLFLITKLKPVEYIEKENNKLSAEVLSLTKRNNELNNTNKSLNTKISNILIAIKEFFRELLLYGTKLIKEATTDKIKAFFDDKYFKMKMYTMFLKKQTKKMNYLTILKYLVI